jgi:hypothetical protein
MPDQSSVITITRNANGEPRVFTVDGMRVASIRRSRLRDLDGGGFFVRLYFGPDECDIWSTSSALEAREMAMSHARAF